MSRYRRLKIGGALFYTLALADRGSDLLGRVLINSAQRPLRSESHRLAALPRSDAMADTVEKGKNEPIEIFACTLVETGFS
jgi:hypothetical protein